MSREVEMVPAGGSTKSAPRMWPVKLLKHYVPKGEHEIVGHHTARIMRKDAAGREQVVQEAAFVSGAPMPPPLPGTGFPGKIWAGTVIKLPLDEAKVLLEGGHRAERADELPA